MKVYQNTQYIPVSSMKDSGKEQYKKSQYPDTPSSYQQGEALESAIADALHGVLPKQQPTPETLLHNAFKKMPMIQAQGSFGVTSIYKK